MDFTFEGRQRGLQKVDFQCGPLNISVLFFTPMQVVHDVSLQKLPVRFAMDRAGLVGADGATHAGAFDVAFMACLPDIVVMAPSDEAELFNTVATAAAYDEGPFAFRYPRGHGIGVPLPPNNKGVVVPVSRGRHVVHRACHCFCVSEDDWTDANQ